MPMPFITRDLEFVIKELKQGKAVAIPTETVYGLAAMIDKEQAIQAIFSLKNRPLGHPLIVHVAQHWDLSALVEDIPDYAQDLMTHFWPGPLTLVFNAKKNGINPLITGGQSTVAIRSPAHPLAQQLLTQLTIPVVAPSANPFGKISPTTAMHVKQSFSEDDLTILDGGRCCVGIESTIVDATNPQSFQILRHGVIDEQAITAACSRECLHQDNDLRVPGKLDSHYQPKKNLYYFKDYHRLAQYCQNTQDTVYVLASQQPATIPKQHFHPLAKTPEQAAFELFFQLREADASKATTIAMELPPETPAWEGVRERILKAGSAFIE
jgi:L-threonylcarbamoyladenylate synthase